jgi:hypothetical protein
MSTHSLEGRIIALAPVPEGLDEEWADATLARILLDDGPLPRRRDRRRLAVIAMAGVLTVSTGTAIAAANAGSIGAVKDVLLDFMDQPNTTGNNIGTLGTPELVAKFRRGDGRLFTFWIATSSKGAVCVAYSDGSWDGEGAPTVKQLEYGCGGEVVDPTQVDTPIPLERPDQVGGFFKDEAEPILYGVSPYADAVEVHVQGTGVDRTLPLRADSHGFGSALPEATEADSVTLTFLDRAGQALGSRTYIAPVG